MSFPHNTFCGASVRSFSSSIGWNIGQVSQLEMQLVEDTTLGDVFAPPAVGSPCFFEFGAFRFAGLFQQWQLMRAVDGDPVYKVVLQDPREILEGAQVVVGGYVGPTSSVANVFNPYGFWENQAFGSSLANEAGMPWFKVAQALEAIANTPAGTAFGGPLKFRGFAYSLDLSQLPVTPNDYRVPASGSLLEMIGQVCDDGCADFFVELDGFTIRVRTVSRRTEPPLGTISALVNANRGSVVRSSNGVELRNETTSAFVVGGDVTTLLQTDALTQFWGYDVFGNPVVGQPGLHNFYGYNWNANADDPDPVVLIDQIPCEFMSLNATPVADVIGDVAYPCNTIELRMAQAGMQSWLAYVRSSKLEKIGGQSVSKILRLTGALRRMAPVALQGGKLANDFRDDNALNNKLINANVALGEFHVRDCRLYEFVKGYADEFMGRKYLVGLPFVLQKVDPETLKVTNSYDVTDAGWQDEGAAPLGLSPLNEDVFKGQDGRFRAFVTFGGLGLAGGADLSKVSPHGTVIQDGVLYMPVQADPQIIFAPSPCCVVTLQGAVTDNVATGVCGDMRVMKAVLQVQADADAQNILKQGAFGNIGLKCAPATRAPFAAAVPLKSNILQYGPWGAAGAPGKVRFEQDPSLTPWNYGSFAAMNAAGNAKIANAITNMQLSETGLLELAGPPTASLGDTLQSGGPNVTNIDVAYGVNGVTTSYRFATFTPRFGVFNKGTADKLKRLGQRAQELRRSIRAAATQDISTAGAVGDAARTARAFLENTPKVAKRESPHDVLVAHSYRTTDYQGAECVRVGVANAETGEALSMTNSDADPGSYLSTALMGYNGLVRPFSTNPSPATGNLPHYTAPAVACALNRAGLDPWNAQNDIEFYHYGTNYAGAHAFRRGGDLANARPLGLRGPLVLAGWGYDLDGNPVPKATGGSAFAPNYLKRSDLWKVGPVDHMWDDRRGVWTSHDVVRGTIKADIAPGGSGVLQVSAGSGWDLAVGNWFDLTLPSGQKAFGLFSAMDNRWYAVTVFPSGGGAGSGVPGSGGGSSFPSGCTQFIYDIQCVSGSLVKTVKYMRGNFVVSDSGCP